jgi:site-specific DNA-cytosine methylase
MKMYVPKHVHELWYLLRAHRQATTIDLHAFAKSCFKHASAREIGLVFALGAHLGLLIKGSEGWMATSAGKLFASLKHWRYWNPKRVAHLLKGTPLEHAFLGPSGENRPMVIDLFAGAGGLGLGFESAGFKVAVAVDNDPQACAAHRLNFPDCVVVEDSIERIAKDPVGLLCRPYGIDPSDIHGVVGGPPCQGFSFMGERVILDERNLLTSRFADVVTAIQPNFFVMENVPGLLSIGEPPPFADYLIRLGKSIGADATKIVHRLPSVPKGRAQRDRQFRKKLVSQAITRAKSTIADIVVDIAPSRLMGVLCEAADTIAEQLVSACNGVYELQELIDSKQAISDSESEIILIALGAIFELAISASLVSRNECEDIVRQGLRDLRGTPRKLIADLLRGFDEAPAGRDFKGTHVGPVLSHLIERLSKNYVISSPQVLSSAWYGAPQDRRRLFIVGIHKRIGLEFEFPAKSFDIPGRIKRDGLFKLPSAPTCSDAIGDLPDIDEYEDLITSDLLASSKLTKTTVPFSKRARLEEIEALNFTLPRPTWNPFEVDCCLRTLHEDFVVERLKNTELGEQDSTSHKTRLHPDRVSHTLRAGTREGKGSHTAVRPIHYQYPRVISVREGARLMGYPDWMTFHRTKWHGFRLVGNGVPLHLAHALALQLKTIVGS